MKIGALLAILLNVFACGTTNDGDYKGEVLAEMRGVARVEDGARVADAKFALLWFNSSGSPDVLGADETQVAGTFPANFKISVFHPPADALINHWYGQDVAIAYVVALKPDAEIANVKESDVLGVDSKHLVVYAPNGIAPQTEAAAVLRSTPSAGFHIYAIDETTDEEALRRASCASGLNGATLAQVFAQCGGNRFDDFVPLATDLQTRLEIVLPANIENIRFPNWT